MKSIENEYEELESIIKNIGFSGYDKEIKEILFLDKYIQENINYDNDSIINLEQARENGDKELEKILIQKHVDSFKEVGFFKNKIAVCGSISQVTNKILNDLGIKSKKIYGHIIVNGQAYGHMWNEIELNGKKYNYDFTHNMINNHYYDKGYEMAKQTMPEPKSNVDNSFVKEFSDKRYMGGFVKDKDDKLVTDKRYKEGNFETFNNDFSNYNEINKAYLQQKFNEIEKIYNNIYGVKYNTKSI